VNGSASITSRPWSEARQPLSWKNVWRFSRASSSCCQVPIEAPAAFSSFSTHAVHAARSSTRTALSGRHVGYTCVSGSLRAASFTWGSSESVGSSVLQTTATRNCFRSPIAVNAGSFSRSLARSKTSLAVAGQSTVSIPNGRRSSMCVQW
jgi:hypothetical protein